MCDEHAKGHRLLYNVMKREVTVSRPMVKFQIMYSCKMEWYAPTKGISILIYAIETDFKDYDNIERDKRALSRKASMIARRFARCCSNGVKLAFFRAYCEFFYTCSWIHDYGLQCASSTVQQCF